MANTKIHSLEDLLEEKARVQAQIQIVQEELRISADRTRTELSAFVDNKFSIPKQLGQLFQGNDKQPSAGASAIGAISKVAGLGPWWSGILATLAPMLVNFTQDQLRKRKERKKIQALTASETTPEGTEDVSPPVKKRGFFKRKSSEPTAD
jgi:hypothetical protein